MPAPTRAPTCARTQGVTSKGVVRNALTGLTLRRGPCGLAGVSRRASCGVCWCRGGGDGAVFPSRPCDVTCPRNTSPCRCRLCGDGQPPAGSRRWETGGWARRGHTRRPPATVGPLPRFCRPHPTPGGRAVLPAHSQGSASASASGAGGGEALGSSPTERLWLPARPPSPSGRCPSSWGLSSTQDAVGNVLQLHGQLRLRVVGAEVRSPSSPSPDPGRAERTVELNCEHSRASERDAPKGGRGTAPGLCPIPGGTSPVSVTLETSLRPTSRCPSGPGCCHLSPGSRRWLPDRHPGQDGLGGREPCVPAPKAVDALGRGAHLSANASVSVPSGAPCSHG